MKILITGHKGYIGAWLVPILQQNKNNILLGMDIGLFEGCEIYPLSKINEMPVSDIRNITHEELQGIDIICHLAAISNDPMGELDEKITMDINFSGTIKLAENAKKAGVKRFIFSGSCSIYGSSKDIEISEEGTMLPLSTYAKTKVDSEKRLHELSDENFQVISMRNATAFGWSPSFRTDLVANNLCASAISTGKQTVQSDGEPWRPLVHCKDIANLMSRFCYLKEIPSNFLPINIGSTNINVRVKDIVNIISSHLPDVDVEFMNIAPNDPRNYRVSFKKLETLLQDKNYLEYNLSSGILDMIINMKEHSKNKIDNYLGKRFIRLQTLKDRISKIQL